MRSIRKPLGPIVCLGALLHCGPEHPATVIAKDDSGMHPEEPASGSPLQPVEDTLAWMLQQGMLDTARPNLHAEQGEDFVTASYAAVPLQRSFAELLQNVPYRQRSWEEVQGNPLLQGMLENVQNGFLSAVPVLGNGTGVEASYACGTGQRCGGLLAARVTERGKHYGIFGIAGTDEHTQPFLGWKIREVLPEHRAFQEGIDALLSQRRREERE